MWFVPSRRTRRTAPGPTPRTPFRPRLEALEDRSTPSAGALDTTFGAGTGYVTTKGGKSDAPPGPTS
jgi:hypothetical protein